MNNFIIGLISGFIICVAMITDYERIYDIDGNKTIHHKGHFYRLVEVDRGNNEH